MEGWDGFATIAGGTAGVLIGLLFVAISIRADEIASSYWMRRQGVLTLLLFASALFASLALSVHGQSVVVLGVEILIIATIALVVIYVGGVMGPYIPWHGKWVSRVRVASARLTQGAALYTAGLLLVLNNRRGLYVLVGAISLIIAQGLWTAWLLLMNYQVPRPPPPDLPR